MAEQNSQGRVTSDNADSITTPGSYGHGAKILDGGSFGVLVVFRSEPLNYTAQVDINFEGVFWRFLAGDNWSSWVKL